MLDPKGLSLINFVLFIALLLAFGVYRYYFKRNIRISVFLFCISLLPILSIFRNGSYESSDLTLHTHYLMSFYENIANGIIVPQWTNVGYGTPVFIFLYPLPFYMGSILHFLGFSFLSSMKLVFALSFIGSGIGMYYFLKNEFNEKAGIVGSIFYLFAPFHFVDMHFRASVGETLSFTFIPFVFFFMSKYLDTGKVVFFLLASIFYAFLITSHLTTTLIVTHLLLFFIVIKWIYKGRRLKNLLYSLSALLLGVGLSSFYWTPAILEVRNTLYSLTLPTGGFLSIGNLLYSTGRLFIVFQGNKGDSQYLIGYFHILVFLMLLSYLFRKKLKSYTRSISVFLVISFTLLSFMTLSISKPIWGLIPYLNNFQFAWRLLVPIAFISSFIAGLVALKTKNKHFILICFLTIIITIPNWGNRKMVPFPEENRAGYETLYTEFYDPSDPTYHLIYDDLSKVKVREIPNKKIEILTGNAIIRELKRTPNYHLYIINVKANTLFKENTLYFPGWTLNVNGKPYLFNYKNPSHRGVILFNLNPGIYKVEISLRDTSIRKISKTISLLSLLTSFGILLWAIRKHSKD